MQVKFSLVLCLVVSCIYAEVQIDESTADSSPFLDVLLCPINSRPWDCGKLQISRMLDKLEDELETKKEELKVEADAEYLNKTTGRGFSESSDGVKEKPSTVLTTLDKYLKNTVNNVIIGRDNDDDNEDDEYENENDVDRKKKPQTSQQTQTIHVITLPAESIESNNHAEHSHHHLADPSSGGSSSGGHHIMHHQHGLHNAGGFGNHGLLGDHGFNFKKKHGRSIGVIRGHKKGKKKRKKAIMKLLIIGAVLKAKFELLLKILATHLQIKFFIVALIGLFINIARFWVDIKKGHQPQKVIYYEHAQHQHHYDDHEEGWSGGGGYWKRSFDTKDNTDPTDSMYDDRYENIALRNYSPNGYAGVRQNTDYNNDGQDVLPQYDNSPHNIVYNQQMPLQN